MTTEAATMTPEELRALIEIELEAMRKWEERDYELERAFIDLLDANLAETEAVSRAMALLEENLRKAEPKGNA
jgi:hypothetical protein